MIKISTIKQTEEDPSALSESIGLWRTVDDGEAVNMISGPDTDRHLQSHLSSSAQFIGFQISRQIINIKTINSPIIMSAALWIFVAQYAFNTPALLLSAGSKSVGLWWIVSPVWVPGPAA